jgi:ABC-type nitrate/sulfonate/bicarbonate transport system ATPase subunit
MNDLAALIDLRGAMIKVSPRLKIQIPMLKIDRAAIGVLVGPNGSGKSTLARFICDIKGDETVEAERQDRPSPAAVMVWQSLNLFPLTVKKNMALVRKEGYEAALKYFNLWIHRDRSADFLSGGERQKLAIVRSLVTGADLVVLDEPTSSLDNRSIEDLVEVVGAYTGKSSRRAHDYLNSLGSYTGPQRSVLIITHDLRFVRLLSRFDSLRVFSIAEHIDRTEGEANFIANCGDEGCGYTIERIHCAPPDLFTADFFGVPNVLGFTCAAARPRGPEDFCSRYLPEAVGWIVLRDHAIKLGDATRNKGGSVWKGTIIGTEYIGTQRRTRLIVTGEHSPYELTVPHDSIKEAQAKDIEVSFDMSDTGWSLISP